MSWLVTLGTGLVTAVLGGIVAGILADRWTVWFRVSSFEGASAYFVLFHILIGAVIGGVIGMVGSRMTVQGGEAVFLRGLGVSLACIFALAAVLASVTYLVADHPPRLGGKRLSLEIEVRTPPEHPVLKGSSFTPMVCLENGTGRTVAYWTPQKGVARSDGPRWILPVSLNLASSARNRALRVYWDDDLKLLFPLPLPGKPSQADFTWTDWLEPRQVERKGKWGDAGLDAAFQVRFRVAYPVPPPPPPTDEERKASAAAERAERMKALPADAPLAAWLPFAEYGLPEAERKAVVERIRARPAFETDFAALILDEEPQVAAAGLRLVELLPGPPQPLVAPVTAAGRDLLVRLEKVVATRVEDDPGYQGAADIAVRFSAWIDAARHLRKGAGGDFTPELRALLPVARKRPESIALRQDVVRVASYYLHEWAGDAPDPSDPPPR